MSERAWGHGGLLVSDDGPSGLVVGRHTVDEEAALTPIFHALSMGGWRTHQESPADAAAAAADRRSPAPAADRTPASEPDPVESFRRNPLAAPLPALAVVPYAPQPPSTPASPYVGRRRRRDPDPDAPNLPRTGRHHRRLIPVDGATTD